MHVSTLHRAILGMHSDPTLLRQGDKRAYGAMDGVKVWEEVVRRSGAGRSTERHSGVEGA